MLKTLLFVTGNHNKLREAGQILGMDLKQAEMEDFLEIQTVSVEEAVYHKARDAYRKFKTPLIVEDSGLVFNAWNGLPGALVKWFEKTVKNEGMLKMLDGEKDRTAVAQCFIGLHDGRKVMIAKGEARGTISGKVTGDTGFGWDNIFIPDGYGVTFAQMGAEKKNAISHRKLAFENLKEIIQMGL